MNEYNYSILNQFINKIFDARVQTFNLVAKDF